MLVRNQFSIRVLLTVVTVLAISLAMMRPAIIHSRFPAEGEVVLFVAGIHLLLGMIGSVVGSFFHDQIGEIAGAGIAVLLLWSVWFVWCLRCPGDAF
ncbi:MAG: hypothetical protein ACI9G1_000978 [Pirellulaceae bacterium]|jgi:hypothetical protein